MPTLTAEFIGRSSAPFEEGKKRRNGFQLEELGVLGNQIILGWKWTLNKSKTRI